MLNQEKQSPTQENFENKILPLLKYIGLIGAIVMGLVYFLIVVVMIVGFQVQQTQTTLIFAVVNAIVGILIMQMLKVQGISFAKSKPENKQLINDYYQKETKDKKYVSINRYWVTTVIKDILIKGLSLAVTTAGLIHIIIQGSQDYNLLLMAIANLLMFTCFGLLALNSAYEFYNTRHVPYMQHQLKIMEEKQDVYRQKRN